MKENVNFKYGRLVLNNFKYYHDFFISKVGMILNVFPLQ